MDYKILYTRGDQIYVVEYEGNYYLIALTTDEPPLKYEFVEAILKFGYFEDFTGELSDDDRKEIETRLAQGKSNDSGTM